MEDTTPEIRRLVYQTVMARTEEERFIMCAEMFETAKAFARMNMPEGLSAEEEKRFIFERIYGEPMPVETLAGVESNV